MSISALLRINTVVAVLAAPLGVAALTGATLTGDAALNGAEAGCPRYITHWGRMSRSRWMAKNNAEAGMDWKIRNRLGDTVQMIRGIRFEQCKRRYRPWGGRRWQCQTSAVVNTCF